MGALTLTLVDAWANAGFTHILSLIGSAFIIICPPALLIGILVEQVRASRQSEERELFYRNSAMMSCSAPSAGTISACSKTAPIPLRLASTSSSARTATGRRFSCARSQPFSSARSTSAGNFPTHARRRQPPRRNRHAQPPARRNRSRFHLLRGYRRQDPPARHSRFPLRQPQCSHSFQFAYGRRIASRIGSAQLSHPGTVREHRGRVAGPDGDRICFQTRRF